MADRSTKADRMPPLPEAALSPEQREAAAALIKGPRGRIAGPFVPMLRSPEFMTRAQKLGQYLRYDSPVPQRLRELAILITAAHWRQDFEFHMHAAIALKEGGAASTVDALANLREPEDLPGDETVVYRFVTTLLAREEVEDDLFAEVIDLAGENGLIDLLGVVGYYAMIAMIMNTARTPSPETHFR